MMHTSMRCSHFSLKELKLDEGRAVTCDGCQEMEYDECYTCTNGCDYHLHQACFTALPTISHPFFPTDIYGTFVFHRHQVPIPASHEARIASCAACGVGVKGWAYISTTCGRDVSLHPECATIPLSQALGTTFGHVYLKKKLEFRNNCDFCEMQQQVGWAYASVSEDCALHLKCLKDFLYEKWRVVASLPHPSSSAASPTLSMSSGSANYAHYQQQHQQQADYSAHYQQQHEPNLRGPPPTTRPARYYGIHARSMLPIYYVRYHQRCIAYYWPAKG